jgi:hypothetical protein
MTLSAQLSDSNGTEVAFDNESPTVQNPPPGQIGGGAPGGAGFVSHATAPNPASGTVLVVSGRIQPNVQATAVVVGKVRVTASVTQNSKTHPTNKAETPEQTPSPGMSDGAHSWAVIVGAQFKNKSDNYQIQVSFTDSNGKVYSTSAALSAVAVEVPITEVQNAAIMGSRAPRDSYGSPPDR